MAVFHTATNDRKIIAVALGWSGHTAVGWVPSTPAIIGGGGGRDGTFFGQLRVIGDTLG